MISLGGSHKQRCQISNFASRTTAIEINGNAYRQLSPGILDLLGGNICIVKLKEKERKKEPAIPLNSLGKQKKKKHKAWPREHGSAVSGLGSAYLCPCK